MTVIYNFKCTRTEINRGTNDSNYFIRKRYLYIPIRENDPRDPSFSVSNAYLQGAFFFLTRICQRVTIIYLNI